MARQPAIGPPDLLVQTAPLRDIAELPPAPQLDPRLVIHRPVRPQLALAQEFEQQPRIGLDPAFQRRKRAVQNDHMVHPAPHRPARRRSGSFGRNNRMPLPPSTDERKSLHTRSKPKGHPHRGSTLTLTVTCQFSVNNSNPQPAHLR